MQKSGHVFTGMASGLLAMSILLHKIPTNFFNLNIFFWLLIVYIFTMSGGTAPDWLEISWWDPQKGRQSVIKHRTITHVLILWIGAFVYSFMNLNKGWTIPLLGFSIGGLTHLLFDIPNPTGVPIWHPYKRFSFKLWKSGENEFILIMGWWAICSFIFITINPQVLSFFLMLSNYFG